MAELKLKKTHYLYHPCQHGRRLRNTRVASTVGDVTCEACCQIIRWREARDVRRAIADVDEHDVDRCPSF
jgi:hypothetical protein